jgi:hypothetical protein
MIMAESSDSLKTAKVALSKARGFSMLWLKLVCLGGFIVLIGGPFVMGILQNLFGPAAAKPGRVITLDMLFTLPLAIFFWIQQNRLAEGETACPKCGEHYPKTNASCPMCGSANSSEKKED